MNKKHIADEIIQKAIELYDNQIPNGVIASKLHISTASVSRILSGDYDPRFRSQNYPRKKGWQTKVLYESLEQL